MRARAASRCIQSTVTLLLRLVTSSWAITRRAGLAHDLLGALVFGKRVVESDFLVAQARLLPSLPCRTDVLGEANQLFQHLDRGDGVRVIAFSSAPLRKALKLSTHGQAHGRAPIEGQM